MSWDGKERRHFNVEDRLGQIKEELQQIALDLRSLTEQYKNLHTDKNNKHQQILDVLQRHTETIYGNGHAGLTTRVSNIESLPKKMEDHSRNDIWGFGIMISLLVTTLGWTIFHK